MNINNAQNTIGEVYWLLDRIIEDLSMVKQLIFESYESHERLLVYAVLALSGLINDDTYINIFIKDLENSRWRAWTWTLSFYLGVLIENYIRKRRGLLLNVNEINNLINEINKKLNQFYIKRNIRKVIDALFLDALVLDITTNVLGIDVSAMNENIKFIDKFLSEYDIKTSKLQPEYKVKMAYSLLIFSELFNKSIQYNYLKELIFGSLESLDSINIEYRTFMLRILTSLQMIEERQLVLKSLVNEYKSRFMYTTEKKLLKKLVAELVSGKQDEEINIKYKEDEEIITLEIILTDEEIENIARPNVIQLSLMALGLMLSGYHSSYTLPFLEQRNYMNFINFIKEIKDDKVHKRLMILDRLEFNRILIDFLNEKVWRPLRNELICKMLFFLVVSAIVDFLLLPLIGKLAHMLPALTIILFIYYILKVFSDITHVKLREVIFLVFKKESRQVLIESLRDEFYKRLKIAR